MATTNNLDVVQLAKINYGDLNSKVLPLDDLYINQDIPFSEKERVGQSYIEAIVLGSEVGITFAGSGNELANINPAIAGAVRQATITPYISALRSVIPWQAVSRTAGGAETAFLSASKHVVKNNMISHKRFLEIAKIYGQDTAKLLGRVSYATATYRGVSLTAGAGTLVSPLFGSLTFATGGIVAATKHILLAPGDNASGIWVGMQGVKVKQLLASDLSVVAEGKLVAYDSSMGILKVDFTPIAASATGSHILCFEGMELSNEMIGIKKIIKNTGTLFGINAATYPLWQGNTVALGAVKLTMARLENAVANAINAGGLSGDVVCYVNPRTFHNVISTELASRQYDYSYDKKEIVSGGKAIRFAYADGDIILKGHRYVMEGDALVLRLEDWVNAGSQDIQMSIAGLPDSQIMYFLQEQMGYVFNTYSDQFMLCRAPAKQILIDGINDESAS